jgi:hypothetical protein
MVQRGCIFITGMIWYMIWFFFFFIFAPCMFLTFIYKKPNMFRSLFQDHLQELSLALSAYHVSAARFVTCLYWYVVVCPLSVFVSGVPAWVLSGRALYDQTALRQVDGGTRLWIGLPRNRSSIACGTRPSVLQHFQDGSGVHPTPSPVLCHSREWGWLFTSLRCHSQKWMHLYLPFLIGHGGMRRSRLPLPFVVCQMSCQ